MGINHASGGGSREFQAFKRRNKPMYSQSTLSGSSQGQKDSKPKNKVSEIIARVGRGIIEGAIVGALCAAFPAAAPGVIAAYKLYKMGKSIKEVQTAVKKEKINKVEAGVKAASKEGIKHVVGNIVDSETDKAASDTVKTVSPEARDLASEMVRNTIKYASQESLNELASYTIDKGAEA